MSSCRALSLLRPMQFPAGVSVWNYFRLVVVVVFHAIGVTAWSSSNFFQHARMFLYEQALASLDDQLGARSLGYISFELLFLVQVAMVVRVSVGIRLPLLQVGHKVSLVVVGTKASLLLLQRVDQITTHCKMLRSIFKANRIVSSKHTHTPGVVLSLCGG